MFTPTTVVGLGANQRFCLGRKSKSNLVKSSVFFNYY